MRMMVVATSEEEKIIVVVFAWLDIRVQHLYLVDTHFAGYVQGNFGLKEVIAHFATISYWKF